MMKPLAIYIHVPFCVRKCDYCDFASFAGCESQFDAYFGALNDEIEAWREVLSAREITSIFFGGGTPSLPPVGYVCDALAHIHSIARFAGDIEITLEANPGTITPEKLAAYRGAGVNRISIGVQSFDADLLKSLGRIHSPRQAQDAIHMAHAAGFENISLDLMYALPGQTMQAWRDTIGTALALPIRHISAYSLIVEEGTRMFERVARGEVVIPDDETVNKMQRYAIAAFAQAGMPRYEISNFAMPGFESRHNMTYWLGGDYLGLGSAAHSLMDDMRFSNPSELAAYLAGQRMLDKTARTCEDRMEERLMLATRMVRGLELGKWAKDFGFRLEDRRAAEIRKMERYGLVEIKDGFLRLTTRGLELQDAVALELMD